MLRIAFANGVGRIWRLACSGFRIWLSLGKRAGGDDNVYGLWFGDIRVRRQVFFSVGAIFRASRFASFGR